MAGAHEDRPEGLWRDVDAPADSQITVRSPLTGVTTTADLYSKEGLELLSVLWIKAAAEHRLMYEPTWLGRPVIQFPSDIVAVQELIWRVRPDVVVETGVAHGGSLILSASMLEILGAGRVVGVDVEIRAHNRAAIESHPLAHRIVLVEGDSIATDTFERVKRECAGDKRVLVMLDSNHSADHVLKELELYHQLVPPQSYIVVHDGAQAWVSDIPRGRAEWRHDNPLLAIERFLASHPDFEVDPHYTRQLITSSPHGFLRRVPTSGMVTG